MPLNKPSEENEKSSLLKAMAVLEEKRAELGNDTVEIALASLQARLDEIEKQGDDRDRKLRKYVTVLFADISDFTGICRSNDAEYVTEALNRLWAFMDSIIVNHGGHIDKHIGDAVMALWGTETVRENDTEQALRAALAMQEASEKILPDSEIQIPKFRMRIGVHCGPVFLSSIGLNNEYTAMGDTVNIASRLQSKAPLGCVVASHEAYRNVRNIFSFAARDLLEVKGVSVPLKTYAVLSANPKRFLNVNTGVLGIETEMFGRKVELDSLLTTFRRAMSEACPQMVTITGDAGIGKSRLLHEFRMLVEDGRGEIVFFNARCTPEMRNVPCSVFRDILKYRMDVREDDSTDDALRKFDAGMGGNLSRDEILLACHYAGFDFSSFDTVSRLIGSPALAAAGQACLIEYFRSTAASSSTLIYLEDLHWADNTSLDLISRMGRDIVKGKLLILALARPPLLELRPDWGALLPHRFIELEPLCAHDSCDLIASILRKVENLPEEIVDLVISSSEGNPFYVEELIAMLVEDGVIIPGKDKWRVKPGAMIRKNVPSTLTGILQARLDSLPDEEKDVLQRASVIGRLFWNLAVESMYRKTSERDIDKVLSKVQSRELIQGQIDSTFHSTREYLFKHSILRDVTYDTVLLKLRKLYHRSIAQWLVRNSGDRVSELSGLIAEHYDRSGDRENAIEWLLKSGRAAFSVSSFTESLTMFNRALEIAPDDFAGLAELYLDSGKSLEKLARYDEAETHLHKALEIAESLEESATAASALLVLSWIASLRGERELSAELGLRGFNLAEISEDKAILARATMRIADFDEDMTYESVLSYYRKSHAIYDEMNDTNGIAITLLNMGNIAMHFKQLDDAEARYSESLKVYESLGDLWGIANCLGNLGNVHLLLGEYHESRSLHERSLEISSRIGDGEGEVICNLNLGRDNINLDETEISMNHFFIALKKASALGLLPLALSAMHQISRLKVKKGEYHCAATVILYLKENGDADLLEEGGDDLNELMEEISAELSSVELTDIRASAKSMSLSDVTRVIINSS